MTVVFGVMLVLQYFGRIFLQVFIGMWADYQITGFNSNKDIYMYFYIGASAVTLILDFMSLYSFMCLAINATRKLYGAMTRAIIRTKLSFFDVTPNGTIVNKFTKDTESMDVQMMRQIIMIAVNAMGLITLVFILAVNWPAGIVIIPIFIIYFRYFHMFRIVTPSLKKLDLVFKGPIISQSNETMRSLPLIRCMRFEKTFSKVFR